jgi:hypothetical protein
MDEVPPVLPAFEMMIESRDAVIIEQAMDAYAAPGGIFLGEAGDVQFRVEP